MHWCNFCRVYHSSVSCYHPANLYGSTEAMPFDVAKAHEMPWRLLRAIKDACNRTEAPGDLPENASPTQIFTHALLLGQNEFAKGVAKMIDDNATVSEGQIP